MKIHIKIEALGQGRIRMSTIEDGQIVNGSLFIGNWNAALRERNRRCDSLSSDLSVDKVVADPMPVEF